MLNFLTSPGQIFLPAPKVNRTFGAMVADVTVEERHIDDTFITQHPVEAGAPVTDHAYLQPAQLVLELGWSNSSESAANSGDPKNYAVVMYQRLRDLQASRQPFTVVTGKRKYENMLIKSLRTTTNRKSEYSLPIVIYCQQVNLARAETVMIPDDKMASPERTGSIHNRGRVALQPGTNLNVNALPQGVPHP